MIYFFLLSQQAYRMFSFVACSRIGSSVYANFADWCLIVSASSFLKLQNTKSTKGKIRYLVYCMENAILNLPPDQEQMVWLIDFKGFNLSNISIRTTKETADVLQNHYPERLGLAILYNPPKFFEPFWTVRHPLFHIWNCKVLSKKYLARKGLECIVMTLLEL